MKIGFLIPDLSAGGAERATSALANFMAEKGNEVYIITMQKASPFYYVDERVTLTAVNAEDISSLSKIKRIIGTVKKNLTVRRTVKALKLDVLLGMSSIMTMYALFSTVFTKTKAVGNERSNPFAHLASGVKTELKKITSLFVDGYILQTERAAQFFPKTARKKAAVIPNAVFNPVVFETERCFEKQKTVCSMGRLVETKGFDVLIKAFAVFSKLHPEYELKIFGDGVLMEELKELAAEQGVAEKTFFPGNDLNAVRKVAQCEMFVFPSRMEGMPNALMEAMACGVACVSTDCDMGPAELIENSVNGFLVPVDDVHAMARAMQALAEDEALRRSVEDEAHKIRETHSIEDIGARWLAYLEKICK